MDDHRHIAVSVRVPKPQKFAHGGLAQAAKDVADHGVGGDTMIIHVNKNEFDQLRQHWGDPTINPHTGMPQFTPFYKQDWFKSVAPIVGAGLMLIPGLGEAIGAPLLSTLGVGEGATVLGANAAGVLGNGIIGAGTGALTNGAKGAVTGGLLGAGGTIATSALSNLLNGGLTGSSLAGGITGGGSSSSDPSVSGSSSSSSSNADYSPGTSGSSSSSSSGNSTGNLLKGLAGGFLVANAIGQLSGANSHPSAAAQAAAAQNQKAIDAFNAPLPQVDFSRSQIPLTAAQYHNYGFTGGTPQFANNTFPQVVKKARGGIARAMESLPSPNSNSQNRFVQGPGDGRSDSIPAKLSNNEYVMDAETTALLGNGSPEAGAKALDQLRINVRKHKGGALSRGQFSPDAKSPEAYMRGGRTS